MQDLWSQIEQSLSAKGCLEQMGLRAGASECQIADLEAHVGVRFPDSLRTFLSIHDGQERRSSALKPGRLLPIADIRCAWDLWREMDEEYMNANCAPYMKSSPEGFIKLKYTNRAWIPLLDTAGGNYVGLDYDPDIHGTVGQVIPFGRNEDCKSVLASSFEEFVQKMVASVARCRWNGYGLEPEQPDRDFLQDFR
jgi:cell wall assembly regulator SMI1